MKSKCCKAKVHSQEGTLFCSNCISIISVTQPRFRKRFVFSIIASLLCMFVFVQADAPSKNNMFTFAYSAIGLANKPSYAIDVMQIRLIESNNKSDVVSIVGATGDMQIMPVTLEDWNKTHPKEQYKESDLTNSRINMKIGAWMLQHRIPQIMKSKGVPMSINNVLIGYNWGVKYLVDWYKDGAIYSELPSETQQYICRYWSKF